MAENTAGQSGPSSLPGSTPSSLVWEQGVDVYDGDDELGFLCGPSTRLPIYPFPGLVVGALTVELVLVNQGEITLAGGELTYCRVSKAHAEVLRYNGWEFA